MTELSSSEELTLVSSEIAQLCRSDRGRKALRNVLHLLSDGGDSLDLYNQRAVLNLLRVGFTSPQAQFAMHEAIGRASS